MEHNKAFISIIIPAHNEELYIDDTLKHLRDIDYPKDKYEVFVIENGSTDKTYEKAKLFECKNITVVSAPTKGVSLARNFGIGKIKIDSDWVIFLDADTVLRSNFLNDLNNFLQKNQNNNYVVGTTLIKPFPETRIANFWFAFWNLCHKIFKVSFAIQIIKHSLLKDIKYHEGLEMGEDLKLIKDARKYGKFFFLNTHEVYSSTRRFEQIGWWKIFFQWTFVANLPHFLQKKHGYKVIRFN